MRFLGYNWKKRRLKKALRKAELEIGLTGTGVFGKDYGFGKLTRRERRKLDSYITEEKKRRQVVFKEVCREMLGE